MKTLTLKRQAKERAKAFRILKSIGFQYVESKDGGYWARQIPNSKQRLCVGFDVADQCFGHPHRTNWIWQTAEADKEPLFGYSGSLHVGAEWGTTHKVIDITLEQFHSAGLCRGIELERIKTNKVKEKLTAMLNELP